MAKKNFSAGTTKSGVFEAGAVVVISADAPEAKDEAAQTEDKKDDASKDDSAAAETTDDSADAE